MKILIVDDVNTNAAYLSALISSYYEEIKNDNVKVDIASNGYEAIGMEVMYHYDLIFLDVMMPKFDGLEALKAIRTTIIAKHQPYICVLTGLSDKEKIDKCKQFGANAFVTKPYSPDAIITILKNLEDKKLQVEKAFDEEETQLDLSGLV